MTDSNGLTAGAGDPADRIYDSYSDRDDNSSIAPFPPYREREDDDADIPDAQEEVDEVVEQVVDAYGPVDVGIDDRGSDLPTPTPAAAVATTTDGTSTGRVRLFSDAAQPKPPTESSDSPTSASPSPSPSPPTSTEPAKPPSPQPAPPPPYWKHSRDSSSSNIPSTQEPPCRDEGQEPSTSTSSTPTPPKPKPKTKPKGLSIFARPASRPAASNGKRSNTHTSLNQANNQTQTQTQNHRRDTSSSTLDFNVNLITLQDNEADEPAESITSPASQLSHTSHTSNTSNTSTSTANNAWLFGRDGSNPPPSTASTSTSTSTSTSQKHNKNRCSWARRVDIVDHVVINGASSSPISIGSIGGNHPRIGAFVVWTIKVETLDLPSSTFSIYKRYSEFDTLRRRLVASFPQARGGGALPPLPPKSVLGKFKASFLEQRRLGLQYFLNCILLNPEFAGSPILQEFLFG